MKYMISVILMVVVGGAGASEIHVPKEYATVRAALSAAVAGDEVILATGTYTEVLLPLPAGVVLRGATGDPADVILEGIGTGSIIQDVDGCDDAAILGLTFRNGLAPGGAAIRLLSPRNVRILRCVFRDNIATARGGAIHIADSATYGVPVVFEDCLFVGNSSTENGGAIWTSVQTVSRRTSFDGNTAGGHGGAVYIWRYTSDFSHTTFTNNRSGLNGGAVSCSDYSGSATMADCTASDNSAGANGGALYLVRVLERSVIERNSSGVRGGGCYGIGAALSCTFTGNVSDNDGGGVYSIGRSEDCLFSGNIAAMIGGGFSSFDMTSLQGSTLENNTASQGGGAYIRTMDQATAPITNCQFLNNAATEYAGAVASIADLHLLDTDFSGNTAPAFPTGSAHDVFLACCETDPAEWSAFSITIDDSECPTPTETMSFGRLKSHFR